MLLEKFNNTKKDIERKHTLDFLFPTFNDTANCYSNIDEKIKNFAIKDINNLQDIKNIFRISFLQMIGMNLGKINKTMDYIKQNNLENDLNLMNVHDIDYSLIGCYFSYNAESRHVKYHKEKPMDNTYDILIKFDPYNFKMKIANVDTKLIIKSGITTSSSEENLIRSGIIEIKMITEKEINEEKYFTIGTELHYQKNCNMRMTNPAYQTFNKENYEDSF